MVSIARITFCLIMDIGAYRFGNIWTPERLKTTLLLGLLMWHLPDLVKFGRSTWRRLPSLWIVNRCPACNDEKDLVRLPCSHAMCFPCLLALVNSEMCECDLCHCVFCLEPFDPIQTIFQPDFARQITWRKARHWCGQPGTKLANNNFIWTFPINDYLTHTGRRPFSKVPTIMCVHCEMTFAMPNVVGYLGRKLVVKMLLWHYEGCHTNPKPRTRRHEYLEIPKHNY
jgi:hypothetical protein